MLSYSPWKIEQSIFDESREVELEQQLALSNGYISQYGFFEEYYSGPQNFGTYLRGIAAPLPPVATVSVRLGEDRLDLHEWHVESFYRCLNRQEPHLEREVVAQSPSGHRVRIKASRMLSTQSPQLMTMRYSVESLNYEGPVSLLSLLGDAAGSEYWYPLTIQIDDQMAEIFLQSMSENVQVELSMTTTVTKNGAAASGSRIRIEKSHIVGYSHIDTIAPGDVFVLEKKVSFADNINFPK